MVNLSQVPPLISSLRSSNNSDPSLAMEAEECDTNLALSIGGGGGRRIHDCKSEKQAKQLQEEGDDDGDEKYSIRKRGSKPRSEDMEAANNFDAKEGGGSRKKLKLSKEQIALLEGSFTEHNTLNPMQKQELATRLNIQPRQVEVWFQNRRARSKLKQTEGELDYLKKWSEKLSEENQRLKEEIEELRRRRRKERIPASPLHMHLTKFAQTSACPSCGRGSGTAASGISADDSFSVKREIGDNWNLYITG